MSLELHEWVVQMRQSLKEEGALTPPGRVTFFLNDFEVLLRKLRLRETSSISFQLKVMT